MLTIGLRLTEVVMTNEFVNANLSQTYDSASGIALLRPISFVSSAKKVFLIKFLDNYDNFCSIKNPCKSVAFVGSKNLFRLYKLFFKT